ncbi:MAG TPA: phosphate ABC transporter, permease protein PstA, partial [Coriobacteriia bacterium]|nr:phosphate ABC transporter, permease protein PstA [Coriobacteriia bacterium]
MAPMSGMSRTRRARRSEAVARAVTGLAAVSVVAVALFVLAYIVYHGIGAIDWTFLTDVPRDRGREGGILPVIVGTLWGVATTAGLTLPIGILAGVYLSEYAPRTFPPRAIRPAVTNLA